MINLIPAWTKNYDQFWQSLKRRNYWIIKLRYAAVAMIVFLFLGFEYIFKFELSSVQHTIFQILAIVLLLYNIVLSRLAGKVTTDADSFNYLHLSLIQIGFDLSVLAVITYFTGTIESPLYILFIFHMIIGSLLLPGFVMYTICGLILGIFSIFIYLEYNNYIPHHGIKGLFPILIYNDLNFVLIFLSAFIVMMAVSVFIANTIAHELYKREQELKDTLTKLSEAEAIKQRYTMGVVHEIKTPIVAVQSLLDLVLQKFTGPISEQSEDKLKKARIRSEEAINTINDVLSISKLKLLESISRDKINPEGFLNSFSKNFNSLLEFKNISLKIFDTREDKKEIIADRKLLELAFSNLIGNAIKYTPGKGEIEISINDFNEENLQIEFADSGIGIPEKDIRKIFNDFYRSSNAKIINAEGSGLGLSVVKQIIEQHNGIISAESPSRLSNGQNKGTVIKIILPYITDLVIEKI
jgi:signal transduction histidine kinase